MADQAGPRVGGSADRPLQALLDELRARHGVVGAALGILRDGRIETVASGILNQVTGVTATPEAVFQIGSIGKVFTATLVMQLVDEGRVDLDVAVKAYLPDFMTADRRSAGAITLRQLLCHTSGMDGEFNPEDDPAGPSAQSYLSKMCLLPQLHPPGAYMSYCNAGYVVLGRIVEVLTNRTFATAVVERICKPLGMEHAFADPSESLRYRCAMGHVADRNMPERVVPAPRPYLSISAAAAGSVLSMSAADLLRFVRCHMADGETGSGRGLLSRSSARAMRAAQVDLLPHSSRVFNKWGLGWSIGEHRNCRFVGHDGGTLGQQAYLRCFPEQRLAFTLLTNSPSVPMMMELEQRLLADVVGAKLDPPPPPVRFEPATERYVGAYQGLSGLLRVRREGAEWRATSAWGIAGDPEIEVRLNPFAPDCFDAEGERPDESFRVLFVSEGDRERAEYARIGLRMLRRVS